MFCFKSTVVLGFFSYTLLLRYPQRRSIATRDTVVPMNIEVPTKYPLSHDRIVVFEICLHNKSPMLYRPALHGNWNALSFGRRALKDKFLTPTVLLTTALPNRQVFLPDPVLCQSYHKLITAGISTQWNYFYENSSNDWKTWRKYIRYFIKCPCLPAVIPRLFLLLWKKNVYEIWFFTRDRK